jgi:hypothetical protein
MMVEYDDNRIHWWLNKAYSDVLNQYLNRENNMATLAKTAKVNREDTVEVGRFMVVEPERKQIIELPRDFSITKFSGTKDGKVKIHFRCIEELNKDGLIIEKEGVDRILYLVQEGEAFPKSLVNMHAGEPFECDGNTYYAFVI